MRACHHKIFCFARPEMPQLACALLGALQIAAQEQIPPHLAVCRETGWGDWVALEVSRLTRTTWQLEFTTPVDEEPLALLLALSERGVSGLVIESQQLTEDGQPDPTRHPRCSYRLDGRLVDRSDLLHSFPQLGAVEKVHLSAYRSGLLVSDEETGIDRSQAARAYAPVALAELIRFEQLEDALAAQSAATDSSALPAAASRPTDWDDVPTVPLLRSAPTARRRAADEPRSRSSWLSDWRALLNRALRKSARIDSLRAD